MDAAAAQIETDYPCWHVWRGVSGLWYARRPRSSPPVVLRNRIVTGLRAQVGAFMRVCGDGGTRAQALAAAEALDTAGLG